MLARITALLLVASLAVAQSEHPTLITVKNGYGSVKGFIGGESHDSYQVKVEAGAKVSISIVSKGNRASLMVSKGAEFFGSEPVPFGSSENEGRRWVGVSPEAGSLYIYVTAYPEAHYTLVVRTRKAP